MPHCDICDLYLTTKAGYEKHRLTMHSKVPLLYRCTKGNCSANFARSRELTTHIRIIHHNNHCCCGHDFVTKQNWKSHQLRCHKTHSDKAEHATFQNPGENYLPKIYFVIHETENYFKVGCSKIPMSFKISNLKAKYGENMSLCKSWDLSSKFEEQIILELLENDIHDYIIEYGLEQKKLEYFYFNDSIEQQKIFIQHIIDSIVKKHENNETVYFLPSVSVNHVDTSVKKRKHKICENPTEKQLQNREYCRKWRKAQKGCWIYYAKNQNGIIKIGETTQNPVARIKAFNSAFSHYGNFSLVEKFALSDQYKTKTKRRALEKQIIIKFRQQFPLIAGSEEQFLCFDDLKAIEIIKQIIYENDRKLIFN